MGEPGTVCQASLRRADTGAIGGPIGAVDGVDCVACGVAQDNDVPAIGQSIADPSVVGEGQEFGRGAAAAEENHTRACCQPCSHREVKAPLVAGVVIAERPTTNIDIDVRTVEQLDKFVGIGVAYAVAIRIACLPGWRVGENFDDEDHRRSTSRRDNGFNWLDPGVAPR